MLLADSPSALSPEQGYLVFSVVIGDYADFSVVISRGSGRNRREREQRREAWGEPREDTDQGGGVREHGDEEGTTTKRARRRRAATARRRHVWY